MLVRNNKKREKLPVTVLCKRSHTDRIVQRMNVYACVHTLDVIFVLSFSAWPIVVGNSGAPFAYGIIILLIPIVSYTILVK